MNVARFAARHGRVIVFAVIFITLAGVYSMTTLPSGIYPEVEFPRVVAVAHSGNLSPRLMMITVTRRLEEAAREAVSYTHLTLPTIYSV